MIKVLDRPSLRKNLRHGIRTFHQHFPKLGHAIRIPGESAANTNDCNTITHRKTPQIKSKKQASAHRKVNYMTKIQHNHLQQQKPTTHLQTARLEFMYSAPEKDSFCGISNSGHIKTSTV